MQTPACPQCAIAMERGFMMDQSYGTDGAGQWVSGEPERSIWTGVKTRGRKRLTVASFRCPRCGWLQLFAPEE